MQAGAGSFILGTDDFERDYEKLKIEGCTICETSARI